MRSRVRAEPAKQFQLRHSSQERVPAKYIDDAKGMQVAQPRAARKRQAGAGSRDTRQPGVARDIAQGEGDGERVHEYSLRCVHSLQSGFIPGGVFQ